MAFSVFSFVVKAVSRSCRFNTFTRLCLLFVGISALGSAQTAHITPASTTISNRSLGGGFSSPSGVALDPAGNVFVVDTSSSAIDELLAPDYSTRIRVASQVSLNSPMAIAIDGDGNLYITSGDGTLRQIPKFNGYATATTIDSNLSFPTGVAVDANGNLYVADFIANQLYQYSAFSGYSERAAFSGPFSALSGVAIDLSGRIFVADENAGILEILTSGGSKRAVQLASGNSLIVEPFGIWVDGGGNIFFTDLALGNVSKITAASAYTTVAQVVSNLNEPTGLATDAAGNVFIAETNSQRVDEVSFQTQPQISSLNFGSAAVGAGATSTQTLSFTFDTGGTIAAPSVLTQGASGLDFTDAGTGTCTTNGPAFNYNAGDICTVVVSFTAKYPGERLGAVQLTTNAGVPIVTAYLTGAGIGPQIAFNPSVTTQLGGGLDQPEGIAVDGAGNVFVSDTGNSLVKQLVASSGYKSSITLGSGFSNPEGMAIDGAGNLFLADTGNNAVKELLAPQFTTIHTLGSGFSQPTAVEVDENGNVFVKDSGNNAVKEILAASGYTTVNTLDPNLQFPSTHVVTSGNLRFQLLSGMSQVTERQLAYPAHLAFTAAANGPQPMTVMNLGNAPLTFPALTTGTNPSVPSGISLTGGTCPDIAKAATAQILGAGQACAYEISYTGTNAISAFANLTDNNLNLSNAIQSIPITASQLAPQAIRFELAPSVQFGILPFELSATGGLSGNPVTFSVTSGPGTITGSLLTITGAGTIVIAANQAGNANYAPAVPVLHHLLVTQATQAIGFQVPNVPFSFGSGPVQLTAFGGKSGNPVTFRVVSGPGYASGNELFLTGVGQITVAADQAGNTNYLAAPTLARSLTVGQARPRIVLVSSANPAHSGSPVTLDAILASSAGAPTGTVNFLDGTTSLGTVSLASGVASLTVSTLSIGSHRITAVYNGDANFATATSTVLSESIVIAL